MFKTATFVCLLFVAVGVKNGVFGQHFPGHRPRCVAGDTNCLKTIIQQYTAQSGRGIPEIGLTSTDPLFVPELNIVQGTGPVHIKLNMRNLNFIGLSTAQVTRVVGFGKDPKRSRYEFNCRIPRLNVIGHYKLNGKVILLPVQGDGPATLTLDNIDVSVKGIPRVDLRSGKEYLQFNKLNVDFTTTRLTMNFQNLFNGNKALSASTNQFFNENWVHILNEMKPVLWNAIGNILLKAINPVFASFPYAEFFL